MDDVRLANLTRRNFLGVAASAAASFGVPSLLRATEIQESALANDPMRPQFHLLPARNWMNDPNGPIFFNGKYHMFFQYNPQAAVWGDMSWNHAVSRDMLHWKHLPLAFTPTAGTADAYGCFSGTCIQAGMRVYAIYTGTVKSTPELATIHADGVQESQCIAWSDDPLLVKWTKQADPIIPLPPPGMEITGFRDPSPWKQGDWYYMTVGAGEARVGGCVLLYRSRDLKTWSYLHKLTGGAWNGGDKNGTPTPNPCDDGEMWECPDFFALDGQHVLIYSTLGKVYWQSGTLDEAAIVFVPKQSGVLDLDAFYAPKTQLDAHGRRILWGWIPERRSEDEMKRAGWSGMMTLPRVMRLDRDGTLRLEVAPETARLRGAAIQASKEPLRMVLPSANGEFVCTLTGDAEVSLNWDGTDTLTVGYTKATHAFSVGDQMVKLQPSDPPTLHGFVDGSVIEVNLGQRCWLTRRFYYTGPAPAVGVVIQGSAAHAIKAWQVTAISPNRLTSSADLRGLQRESGPAGFSSRQVQQDRPA